MAGCGHLQVGLPLSGSLKHSRTPTLKGAVQMKTQSTYEAHREEANKPKKIAHINKDKNRFFS